MQCVTCNIYTNTVHVKKDKYYKRGKKVKEKIMRKCINEITTENYNVQCQRNSNIGINFSCMLLPSLPLVSFCLFSHWTRELYLTNYNCCCHLSLHSIHSCYRSHSLKKQIHIFPFLCIKIYINEYFKIFFWFFSWKKIKIFFYITHNTLFDCIFQLLWFCWDVLTYTKWEYKQQTITVSLTKETCKSDIW